MIPAALGRTRFRLQVDVGFGDAVLPRPRLVAFPTVLDHAPPRVRAYPPETVVAEKLQAVVDLGMANSGMKDIHDLGELARTQAIDGAQLTRSVAATFRRRHTALPEADPLAFTETFTEEPGKRGLWAAFLGRTGLGEPATLAEAVAHVARFVRPVMRAARDDDELERTWRPGGPWRAARD